MTTRETIPTTFEPFYTERQLQRKYSKHAEELGFSVKNNAGTRELFWQFVLGLVYHPSTEAFVDMWPGKVRREVYNFYNAETGVWVLFELSGEFISCWKPGETQRACLKNCRPVILPLPDSD